MFDEEEIDIWQDQLAKVYDMINAVRDAATSAKFTNPLPRPYHAATRGLTSLPSLPGHYHGKPLVKPLLGPGKRPPFICSDSLLWA